MVSEKKTSYVSQISSRNVTAPAGCKLSIEEISKLADSLNDGAMFGILTELKDIQEIKLANLAKERSKLVASFQAKFREMEAAQKNTYEEMINDEAFNDAHEARILKQFTRDTNQLKEEEEAALKEFDLKVLRQIDRQVKDQQEYLDVAGLPGMNVTLDHATIKKQMFTISIVESLHTTTSE